MADESREDAAAAAAAAGSNSENGDVIGAAVMPTVKAKVTRKEKGAGGVGARFEAAAAPAPASVKKPALAAPASAAKKPSAAAAAAAEAAVMSFPVFTAKPTPKPAPAASAAAAAPALEEVEGAAAAAPAPALAAAQPVASAAEQEEAAAVVASMRRAHTARAAARVTNPPPAGTEIVTTKEFFSKDGVGPALQKLILKTNPVETAPEDGIYRPISSPDFGQFIVQSFVNYSPLLQQVIEHGAASLDVAKEINKDACTARDPNKVETFYYQKFVRDYLSRNSPYRGLLVYHGLGSGKTCTSIAAAEALYWGGQKKIFVLTPATLSNNYRRELGKCGYFPLRQNNYWYFLAVPDVNKQQGIEFFWLENVLGLPPATIQKQGGGWVPNPAKASNWGDLTPEAREAIRAQQQEHLSFRFSFIHYNGVKPEFLAQLVMSGVREGKSMFDDAVVIVDEIHNLVRTINGTMIGSQPMSSIIEPPEEGPAEGGAGRARAPKEKKAPEPREFTWSAPLGRARPGLRYPRGYSLYRLLQNAVGAKIIALSATPMINYAQELAVLMNLVGGEQRMVSISLKNMTRDPATTRRLEEWAKQRPDIDYYAVEDPIDPTASDRGAVLNVTPVPFGFAKVIDSADYSTRGFVRMKPSKIGKVEASRERNLDMWAVSLVKELESLGILSGTGGAEAEVAVTAWREARAATLRPRGEGAERVEVTLEPDLNVPAFKLHTFPVLPEDGTRFVANFINKATLEIVNKHVLKARASGLVSYYRGGSEELMPRTTRNEVIEVPMSDIMFQEYSKARGRELELESAKPGKTPAAGGAAGPGKTAAEVDLYRQATKTQQVGFLSMSRAACNWVFPEEIERPAVTGKQQMKLLGLDQDRVIAVDSADDVDADMEVGAGAGAGPSRKAKSAAARGGAGAADAEDEEGAEPSAAVLPDEEGVAEIAPPPDAATLGIIEALMAQLEARPEFLNAQLATFSPKYATILANIRASPGPVLVYSQFKTLEGLGIFSAVLRAADEKYVQLDIRKGADGEWEIPEEMLTDEMMERPRYILYTGDQALDKRRLLLQLYNADVGGLPPKLSAQCKQLLRDAPDNRDGRICRVFMITQSGAEGISMFNTRQVHIMEPYWNNVRLQQVIGRAIRLCSHMNLDWDERTVEVFTYLSVFSAEQKASGSKQIMMIDKAMTTDQMIYDIAMKKQKLADGLMEIAQSAAVDCDLHFFEHNPFETNPATGRREPGGGKAVQCYKFAAGARPTFMYHPYWKKDLAAPVRVAGAAASGGGGGGGR